MKHLLTSMAFGIAALLTVVLASFYLNKDLHTNDAVSSESTEQILEIEDVI